MRRDNPPSLLDEMKSLHPARNRGPLPWYLRVSPEHAAELEELRQAFHRGEFGAATLNAVAENLSAVIRSRGISNVGPQGVIRWLKNP